VIFFYFSVLSFSFTKQVLIILSIPSFLLWIVWELILDMCSVMVAWYVLVCWYSPLELFGWGWIAFCFVAINACCFECPDLV
jgi:hypothetical protein